MYFLGEDPYPSRKPSGFYIGSKSLSITTFGYGYLPLLLKAKDYSIAYLWSTSNGTIFLNLFMSLITLYFAACIANSAGL